MKVQNLLMHWPNCLEKYRIGFSRGEKKTIDLEYPGGRYTKGYEGDSVGMSRKRRMEREKSIKYFGHERMFCYIVYLFTRNC